MELPPCAWHVFPHKLLSLQQLGEVATTLPVFDTGGNKLREVRGFSQDHAARK